EVRSLLEFRKGIKSDPSNVVFSSWIFPDNASACPSGFHGVVCGPDTDSVVVIALDRLGLVGELKFGTLTPLKYLQNLTLAGNSLSGRLVPTMGIMSSLQVIDLSGNQFYGPIPSRFNDLWALHYVNLSNNDFSGGFPSGIHNLQQLKTLDLHSNQLQGDIRELIPELRNVEYLDLSRNVFSGSVDLPAENVSSLANTARYVNLNGNALGGQLWNADVMSLFRNLKILDLGNNTITGELPEFRQLPNLQVLQLGNNQFFGSLPVGILRGDTPLVQLDLSFNGFSGAIPDVRSSTLATLNLSRNSLSGSLPPSLGNCVVLDLSGNLLSGDMSAVTDWNENIEVLDLSSNKLTGNVPNLTKFQKLTRLSLVNNSLEGSLPPSLGSFPKLTTVDLSSNRFDGSIPGNFFASVAITNLNLSGNHLTGSLPFGGSHTTELLLLPPVPPMESLDLSNNALTGGLPSKIGDWGRLKLLNLANNSLSGPLPGELTKLSMLEHLDLSHNDFNGQIPGTLTSSLQYLDVAYNNLSGMIPDSLRDFPDSSFSPGNDGLEHRRFSPSAADSGGFHGRIGDRGYHRRRSSGSSIRMALILACIATCLMVAFILFAYRRARFQNFHLRPDVDGDSKIGTFGRPSHPTTSVSFSNDHLLTSNSRSLSGPMDSGMEIVEAATTSGRKSSSSPGSPPVSSSAEQTVTLDVYSPDRLAGELLFLDTTFKFTAEELSRAPAEVLGRSSHGTLYKATLDNGQMLTVKWLRVGLVKSKKDFAKEVRKIGSVRHPNIVPLRAYYWGPREQERLILADYVLGDSLALHLYGNLPAK
ncbi:hypothetical protein M569_11228, partial [Genlisea aurea]